MADTDEDAAARLVLKATDADLDPPTYTIETAPVHGKLTGTPPEMIYTPEPDFAGDDALEFSASDVLRSSAKARIAIHVRAVNDAPTAAPQSVAAVEDEPKVITLQASDVDRSAASLRFRVRRAPLHGTLSATTGSTVTYLPSANYHGPDSFLFDVADGATTSAQATVTIDVASVNDAPVAQPVTVAVNEDAIVTFQLSGSDVEGDPITYATTPPAHGKLAGTPPNLSYTPDADYNGPDSFTYTVSDPTSTSSASKVSIQVKPVNDAPVARPVTASTSEDTAVTVALPASDIDSTQLTFSITSAPNDGTFTLSGGNLTYTPARDVSGTRIFTFRVTDDGGAMATASATIVITPVNDPPVANDDHVATDPGVPLRFKPLGNDSDPEGDALQIDAADARPRTARSRSAITTSCTRPPMASRESTCSATRSATGTAASRAVRPMSAWARSRSERRPRR